MFSASIGIVIFSVIVAILIVLALGLLPAIIAKRRGHHQLLVIKFLSAISVGVALLFGPVFGAPIWLVAMVWSLTSVKSAAVQTSFQSVSSPQFVGVQGPAGSQGKSAYEIWLEQGNTGSVDDFLSSLKAEPQAHEVNITVTGAVNPANIPLSPLGTIKESNRGN